MSDPLSIAVTAAAHWPQITGAPQLFMQRENVVFRVDTCLGPHALRLHRPLYHSAAALRSELDLMAFLAGQGMLVPRPLPSRDGTLLVPAAGRHASLLSWLPGQPMGQARQPLAARGTDRTALFAAIGRQMARLHALTDGWTPPQGFVRPRWDRDGLVGDAPFWGRFWDHGAPEDRTLLLAVRDRARRQLDAATGADVGLIHADIGNENVLVHGNAVHFIDFDDSGFGFRLFDLATTLYKAAAEPDFPELQAALLAGYGEHRPLPDLTLLPLFIVLRSLTYLGWIAARRQEPDIAAKAEAYLATARRLIAAYLP